MLVQFDVSIIIASAFAVLISIVAYFLKAFMARMDRMENRQSQNALNIEGMKKENEDQYKELAKIVERQNRSDDEAKKLPTLFSDNLVPILRRLENIEKCLMAGK